MPFSHIAMCVIYHVLIGFYRDEINLGVPHVIYIFRYATLYFIYAYTTNNDY